MDKKSLNKFFQLLCMMLLILSLSGCVPGDGSNSSTNVAGFFSGVWHGWIAPFSLIYSFFHNEIGIYEIYNNGFVYNLGYYMAIISGFGGLTFSEEREKSNDNDHIMKQ